MDLMQIRRSLMAMKAPRLPSAYQEVEYLEKNASGPYIRTGIDSAENLITTVVVYKDCAEGFVLGARHFLKSQRYNLNIIKKTGGGAYDRSLRPDLRGNDWENYFSADDGLYEVVMIDKNTPYSEITSKSTGETASHDYPTSSAGYYNGSDGDLLLFAVRTGESINDGITNGFFRILSCTMVRNGTMLRNFVPCRRKSGNEPGMYDLVTGTFYTNQGTGAFVLGPDV